MGAPIHIKMINIILIFSLVVVTGCSGQKNLTPLEISQFISGTTGSAKADFCTLDPSLIDQELKIIFVLDISGSNAIAAEGRPATDPNRADPNLGRRYPPLINFISNRQGNPKEFYTLLEFSEESVKISPDLTSIPDTAPFTNDKSLFQNVVTTQQNSSQDAGGTPYKAALTSVINIITDDARKQKEKADKGETPISSNYVISFISDGKPTDGASISEPVNLIKDVLMRLPQNPDFGAYIAQITLNTGYYYVDVDLPEARDVLREMAKAGKGEAFSFDQGTVIDYDKLTQVLIKKIKTSLSEVIVNNVNTIWNLEQVNILPDLDGDLLDDLTEIKLGSNPFVEDSDKNGVRDGIEYLISQNSRPCKDALCDPDKSYSFNGCFDPETNEVLDTDKDKIRDCEEIAMGTDEKKVDSNGDDLPDWLSVKYDIPAVKDDDEGNPAPSAASTDTDFDGVFNLKEVKENTPPTYDNGVIRNLKPYQYVISQTSRNNATGVTCYELNVTDITFSRPNDLIRLFLLENETTQSGRKFYRIIEKRASGYKVKFDQSDFPTKP
ncbi:MAG: VWA domain-containing protein [Bacteriovoracaceae bacterium]|nr:VWA domain-containing protein [Bacteriovoracaceae bacterium]